MKYMTIILDELNSVLLNQSQTQILSKIRLAAEFGKKLSVVVESSEKSSTFEKRFKDCQELTELNSIIIS